MSEIFISTLKKIVNQAEPIQRRWDEWVEEQVTMATPLLEQRDQVREAAVQHILRLQQSSESTSDTTSSEIESIREEANSQIKKLQDQIDEVRSSLSEYGKQIHTELVPLVQEAVLAVVAQAQQLEVLKKNVVAQYEQAEDYPQDNEDEEIFLKLAPELVAQVLSELPFTLDAKDGSYEGSATVMSHFLSVLYRVETNAEGATTALAEVDTSLDEQLVFGSEDDTFLALNIFGFDVFLGMMMLSFTRWTTQSSELMVFDVSPREDEWEDEENDDDEDNEAGQNDSGSEEVMNQELDDSNKVEDDEESEDAEYQASVPAHIQELDELEKRLQGFPALEQLLVLSLFLEAIERQILISYP